MPDFKVRTKESAIRYCAGYRGGGDRIVLALKEDNA
jgi:hypothetical protein